MGNITLLAQWLKESQATVVFTGAGMSTEAGLPDFRSKDGLWKKKDPRQLASIDAMERNPKEFYEFYRMRLHNLAMAKPHEGHKILARWEQRGLIKAIITQNVDGLHHRAGSERVIELHGTLRESLCIKCQRVYPSEKLLEEKIPQCDCQGKLKPGVILFGEMLPMDALEEADTLSRESKLFIVVGSSLEVSPANHFPMLAKQMGAKLVIINLEPTILDSQADLLIKGKAGEILGQVDGLVKEI